MTSKAKGSGEGEDEENLSPSPPKLRLGADDGHGALLVPRQTPQATHGDARQSPATDHIGPASCTQRRGGAGANCRGTHSPTRSTIPLRWGTSPATGATAATGLSR